jgi:hypothetical protein
LFFYKGGQNRSFLGWGWEDGTSGRKENTVQIRVHIDVNAKMIPVETIPEESIKENGGVGEFKYDIFDTL